MGLNLDMQDYAVIGGGILAAAVVGFIVQSFQLNPLKFETLFRWVTGAAVLVSLVFIYKARALWGGEAARALEVVGIGMGIFMLSWIPHIGWHMDSAKAEAPLIPFAGVVDPHITLGFFHAITAASFLIAGYGFYLFWQAGK